MATTAAAATTKAPAKATDLPIVLYHYKFSPYARRVVWYLDLRRIPYKECLQPIILPRPDLTRLGIAYRRIPLLAIGRDVYLDTRLILDKLEGLFPASDRHPALPAPSDPATRLLLSRAVADGGGVFAAAASCMPPDGPALRDPRFAADRADMMGLDGSSSSSSSSSPFSPEAVASRRPAALAEIRAYAHLLESTLLSEGRDWVSGGGGGGPSLADIEAVWPLHWLAGMPGALDPRAVSAARFPRVFAWVGRFGDAVAEAAAGRGRVAALSGEEAAELLLGGSSGFAEEAGPAGPAVDPDDPVVRAEALRAGDDVTVWPTDSGSRHRDRGALVRADAAETVIEVRAPGAAAGAAAGARQGAAVVRLHAPRRGFKIVKSSPAGGGAAAGSRL